MSNITEEVEEIANKTLEEFPELKEPTNINVRIEEILIFSTFLLDTLLCIFVIYLVLRFKKLRTKTNVCFMNWLVTTVLLLLSNPAIFEFVLNLFGVYFVRYSFILLDLFIVMLAGNVMFMFLLSLNLLFVKTNLRFNVALGIVWFLLVMFFFLNFVDIVFTYYTSFLLLVIVCVFGLAILFNLGFFLKHLVSKTCTDDEKVRLNLVAFHFVTFVLIVVFSFIGSTMHVGSVLNMFIMRFIIFIVTTFPIFIVILLIQLDKNFKLCFFQWARRPHSYINSRIYYGNVSDSQANLQLAF